MKLFVKRLSVMLIAALICVFVASCDAVQESSNNSTAVLHEYGNYYLYETHSNMEYLEFLDNFDDTAYEIVDISVTFVGMTGNNEYGNHYVVTYRNIERS